MASQELAAAVRCAEADTVWSDQEAMERLALAALSIDSLRRLLEAPVPAAVSQQRTGGDTIPVSSEAA